MTLEKKAEALREAFGDNAAAVVFLDDGMMHILLPKNEMDEGVGPDGPAMRATVAGMIHHEANEDLWRTLMDRIYSKLESQKSGERTH